MGSFFDPNNMEYVDSIYQKFLEDPQSVDPKWQAFFQGMEFSKPNLSGQAEKDLNAFKLIEAYKKEGYTKANLNPLDPKKESDLSFNLNEFGLSKDDLQSPLAGQSKPLGLVLQSLEKKYCGEFAVDFSHCSKQISDWVSSKMDQDWSLTSEEKKQAFNQLCHATAFETILHKKFVGAKRFSIEGVDALVPALYRLKMLCEKQGVSSWALGMSHRGRLSVIGNLLKRSKNIFHLFDNNFKFEEGFSGDVKYHLGISTEVSDKLDVHLLSNPSHLEAINPVIQGFAKALQDTSGKGFNACLPVLTHGNAAFIGQGITAETLQMSEIKGYSAGGTLHIILNNQLGFTATTEEEKSSSKASDIMKPLGSPIFLANANCPESCLKAMELAFEFRQKFGKDCAVEIVGYRQYGHNEGDEPAFTQPKMYAAILKQKRAWQLFGEKLASQGILDEQDIRGTYKQAEDNFNDEVKEAKAAPAHTVNLTKNQKAWSGITLSQDLQGKIPSTGVGKEILNSLQKVLTQTPEGFNLNSKLAKQIEKSKELFKSGSVNWALAEALAYASLRQENYSIRLSGQDCVRGTFSHRHCGFYDTQTEQPFFPLAQINKENGHFEAINSLLSEAGVMGFEYGYSIQNPNALNVWEAQFGDFSNGAQIIIDQFISAAETKWGYASALTLFLPHGQEGQGPEHSSCRIERYLQLCAENNMQVCNLSSSANLFHLLRKQMIAPYRKPLIVPTPKSKLRDPLMNSPLSELSNGSFQKILCDEKDASAKTLVLCSGKIYLDLKSSWSQNPPPSHMAVARIEQLYPAPLEDLSSLIQSLPGLKRIIWFQEEPENMGAWYFMKRTISKLLKDLNLDLDLHYTGRSESSSTADGAASDFEARQKKLLEAFHLQCGATV